MITDQLRGSSGVTGSNGIALEKQLKELQATVAAMSQFIGTYKINAVQANLQEANIPALTFVQGNGSNLALTGQLNFNQATGEHGYIKRLSVDNIQVLNAQESESTYKNLTVLNKAKIKELEVDSPIVNLQVTNLSTNRTQTDTAVIDTATVNYATIFDGAIEGSVKFGTAGQMINSAGQVVFVDNGSTVNVGSTNRAIQFNSTIRPKWGNVSLAIEGDGTSAFSYKGSVEDVTDLQALISTSVVGDTYMVQQISGANPGIAIFNGTTFDLTIYYLLANYRTSAEQDIIDTATRQMISSEATMREHADANLQSQITSNKNEADVAIAALQAKDLLHDGLIQANTDAIDDEVARATTEEANLQTQINGKVGNAPVDGVPYCRKDGAWVDVTEEVQGLNREHSGQSVVTSLSNDDDGFKVTSSAPMTVTTAPDNAADVDLDKVVTKGYIDTNLNLSKADDDWRQHHGDQLTMQLMSGAFSPADVSSYKFTNNKSNNGIDRVRAEFCYDGKEWFYATRDGSATVIASNPSKGKQRVLSFDGFGSPSYTAEAVQLQLCKVNAHYTGDAAGVVYVSCSTLAQSNIFFALKDGKILGGMQVGATTPAAFPAALNSLSIGMSARNHSAVWLPRTGLNSGSSDYFDNVNATYGYVLGMNDLGEEDVLAAKKFDFPATGNWGAYGNQAAGNENVWFPNANYNENYRILCCKPDGTTGVFNVLSADTGTVGAPITHTRVMTKGPGTTYFSSTHGKRTFTDSNGNVWGTFYGTLNATTGAFIYRCDDTLQDNEPIKAWRLTTKGSDSEWVHAAIGQEFAIEEVGDYIYVFSALGSSTPNTTDANATPNYYRILKSGNSAPQALTKAGAYRMGAICNRGFDNEGNLWVTYSGAIKEIEKIGLDGSITTIDTNTGTSVNWGRMAWNSTDDDGGGGCGKGNSVFQMADGTLVILGFDGTVASSDAGAKILKVMTIKNGTFVIHDVNHTIFNKVTAVPIGNAIFFAPGEEATTIQKQGTFAMFFNGTNTPIYRKFTSFGGITINSSRVQPWWNLVYHDLAAGNGCKAFTMNKLDLLPVMFTATFGRSTTISPANWAIHYGYWKIDSDTENDIHLRDNEKVLSTITL